MILKDNLHIVCVYNPFEAVSQRDEISVFVQKPKTIQEYIEEYYAEIPEDSEVCACYNGRFVEKSFIINSGGILTFTSVPSGGDNQTLRLIAAAAIVVISVAAGQAEGIGVAGSMLSGATGGAIGVGSATAGLSMAVTASLSIGGMMLLNSIWPIEKPHDSGTGSRNYSFSGSSNMANDGDVVPELIGTVRIAPPMIAAYRSLDGDTSTNQYINMLFALGDITDGPILLREETDVDSPIYQNQKIYLNSSTQVATEIAEIETSLIYNKAITIAEAKELSSSNKYFPSIIHEHDIGAVIPLDIHLDTSNKMEQIMVTQTGQTTNGFTYASFPIAGNLIDGDITLDSSPTSHVYTTNASSQVNEIGVKFGFHYDKDVINRTDKTIISKSGYSYTDELGVENIATKDVAVDVKCFGWLCVFYYKKTTETQWQNKKFAILSPSWTGKYEVDGGLWYEQSGLSHPDEDIGEESIETLKVFGDQQSISFKLAEPGTYNYACECYSFKIFPNGGASSLLPYTGGNVSTANPDFVILHSFTESVPGAVTGFDLGDGGLDNANDITVVLFFNAGLIAYKKANNISTAKNVMISIGIRKTDGSWVEKTVDITKKTRTPFRHAVHFSVADINNIGGGASSQFEVRAYYLKDYSQSNVIASCVIDYVQTSKLEPIIYNGIATLSARIKATQRVSGAIPLLEIIAKKADYDFLIDGETELTAIPKKSCNPAWACMHRLHKFGVKDEDIRVDQFAEWAIYCDANNFECNFYIDQEMSLSETLALIARCGRAAVVQRGVYYGVIIDRVETPVQLFTDGNIVADSFTETYLSAEELANVVCVWFYDVKPESGISKRRAIEVRSPNILDTDEIKRIEVEFSGCTTKEDAVKYANRLLNQTINTKRIIEFTASIDAIVCEVGDVIMIATNSMNWTIASGRTRTVSSTYFEIDRPIKIESIYSEYIVRIRKNDPGSNTDVITEMVVTPSVTDPLIPFTRFNTDIGLNPTDSSDQDKNSFIYALGARRSADNILVHAKTFRVVSIEKESNQFFKIKASEYKPEMYSDSVVVGEIETPVIQREYIEGLKGIVNFSYDGKPYVTLTWRGKSVVFYVFYRTINGNWIKFSEAIETMCNVRGVNFTPNEEYEFSVSVSDNPGIGKKCSLLIPSDHIPLDPGEKEHLSDSDYLAITGLEIVGQANDTIWKEKDLKIRWNEIVYDFEAKVDSTIEGASTSNSDMRELRKFRVELYDKSMNPIKNYIVYEPHFELPFDENKNLYKQSLSRIVTTPLP